MVKFSLIIPVAPERGAEILNSIKQLDYKKSDFEVIVVRGRNPSENRNEGVKKSKANIVIFLDDDAVLENDYLDNVEKFLDEHKEIDIVGGPQLTPKDEKGFARISGYALSSVFGSWKISNRYELSREILNADETFLTSANLACRKKIFDKIKFNTDLFPGEDPKFISDAKKEGFNVAYSPKLIVYHRRRANLIGFMKQVFSYGRTRPQKESFFETLKMPFFFIPSLFLIYIFILLILILINPIITGNVIGSRKFNNPVFAILTPLILYIVIAVFSSVHDSIKNRDYKAIFILPLIYFVMHISYGYGMIYGYVKKSRT